MTPRRSLVEGFRSGLGRALEALAHAARQKPTADLQRQVAELYERVEYLEDSFALFVSRAERAENELRPWSEIRR